MTKRIPDAGRQDAELGPDERPQRARRKPTQPKLHIAFMPEGRGGPREDKGSVPLEVDVEAHIEERTDCEPGLYRIEKKRSGEFSGEVLWYTKEDYPESTINLGQREEDEERGFQLDAEPPPTGTDPASIARLVASTVRAELDARERRERATQGQPSAMDILRETRQQLREEREAVRAEIQSMLPKENPAAREPELTDKQRLELAVIKETGAISQIFGTLREAMGTVERVDEPRSLTDKLLDFAGQYVLPIVGPYVGPVVGPVLAQKAASFVGAVDPNALAQQIQQPQQTQESAAQPAAAAPHSLPPQVGPTPEQALINALNVVVTGLRRGKRPGASADTLDELLAKYPQFQSQVDQLISTPDSLVLAELSRVSGEDLSVYTGALEFIAALKDELRPDDGEESEAAEIAPVSPSRNGHAAQEVGFDAS